MTSPTCQKNSMGYVGSDINLSIGAQSMLDSRIGVSKFWDTKYKASILLSLICQDRSTLH